MPPLLGLSLRTLTALGPPSLVARSGHGTWPGAAVDAVDAAVKVGLGLKTVVSR